MLLEKGEPGLDVEETLLTERLEEEQLDVQVPYPRVRVPPQEIIEDRNLEG